MKLPQAVEAYLDLKHSLGMRMETEGLVLKAFCRAIGNLELDYVRPAAVLEFISGTGPTTRNRKQKTSVLRSFYRFALARELTKMVPLPATEPQYPPLRSPYLYSTAEIERLLVATDILQSPRAPLRATGFRTLLLLLYSTGMRISEALALTLDDIDLAARVITIHDTKFHKTRLVPIGPRLTHALSEYVRCRVRDLPMPSRTASAFLARTSGTHWDAGWTEALFCRVRNQANVTREGNTLAQPHLHDLRHTRVQHQILTWYRTGRDVQHLLPKLATYLGHVDVHSLQHYLAITPELLREANARFERYASLENSHA